MFPDLKMSAAVKTLFPPNQRKSLKSLEKCKLLKPLGKIRLVYRGFVETRKGASVHNLVRADVIKLQPLYIEPF